MVNATPRNIRPEFDPTNLQVTHLQKGFMVDHGLRTWDVTEELQFDWFDGKSERELTLSEDLEKINLLIRDENGFEQLLKFNPVNLYALDNRIGQEITLRNRPSNVISYQGTSFYREGQLDGICFSFSDNQSRVGEKTTVWEYLDEERQQLLRIERRGRDTYRAMIGQPIHEWEFSDILPRKISNSL